MAKRLKSMWNKNFILLLQGGAVSHLGDVLYTSAIGYWILQETGSTAIMGIMSSISMFMVLFVIPFSGSVSDKSDRKKLIVFMDTARGLLMLAVGVMAYSGLLSVPAVLAATVAMALCNVFFDPAATTAFMDIIPKRQFVRGQSIKSSVYNLSAMAGQGISGMVINIIGVPFAIIANGISFLISAFTELFIHLPHREEKATAVKRANVMGDVKQGVKTVLANPALKIIVLSAIAVNVLSSGSGRMMMAFCLQSGLTIEQYGFVISIGSGAALLAVIVLSARDFTPKTRYYIMCIGFILTAVFYTAMCLIPSFYRVGSMYGLSVFANCVANVVLNAALMLAVPKESRGTVLGVVQSASTGAQAVSTLLYGFLGEFIPLKFVYLAGNLLSLVPFMTVCRDKNVRQLIITN